ncbi:hypothetical protein EDC01DRAFT_625908 [Geopyxis carbonaria]|nr:hypothetical protein EDC01DRAFT_625908 [Geopyxis carbonaria]
MGRWDTSILSNDYTLGLISELHEIAHKLAAMRGVWRSYVFTAEVLDAFLLQDLIRHLFYSPQVVPRGNILSLENDWNVMMGCVVVLTGSKMPLWYWRYLADTVASEERWSGCPCMREEFIRILGAAIVPPPIISNRSMGGWQQVKKHTKTQTETQTETQTQTQTRSQTQNQQHMAQTQMQTQSQFQTQMQTQSQFQSQSQSDLEPDIIDLTADLDQNTTLLDPNTTLQGIMEMLEPAPPDPTMSMSMSTTCPQQQENMLAKEQVQVAVKKQQEVTINEQQEVTTFTNQQEVTVKKQQEWSWR